MNNPLEIERKILFHKRPSQLDDMKKTLYQKFSAQETYFVHNKKPWFFRYQKDKKELTAKSYGKNIAIRNECNLFLGEQNSEQSIQDFFFCLTGEIWQSFSIKKNIEIWQNPSFPNLEFTFYEATALEKVFCFEIEALNFHSPEEGLNDIDKALESLNWNFHSLSEKTLFDLLILPQLSPDRQQVFLQEKK